MENIIKIAGYYETYKNTQSFKNAGGCTLEEFVELFLSHKRILDVQDDKKVLECIDNEIFDFNWDTYCGYFLKVINKVLPLNQNQILGSNVIGTPTDSFLFGFYKRFREINPDFYISRMTETSTQKFLIFLFEEGFFSKCCYKYWRVSDMDCPICGSAICTIEYDEYRPDMSLEKEPSLEEIKSRIYNL